MKLSRMIDTIPEVALAYALTTAAAATAICLLEGWSAGETAWWTIVTVTTTGYGDISPHTASGRTIAAGLMALAWFFNLLLGAQVAAKLIVNSDAWTHDEQEGLKEGLRRIEERMK